MICTVEAQLINGLTTAVLLLVIVADLFFRRIPHWLTIPTIAIAAWLRYQQGNMALLSGVIGCLFGFVLMGAVYSVAKRHYKRVALGFGDVLLAAVIGMLLGIPYGVWALAYGMLIGGCVAALQLLRGADRLATMPYGAWLALAALIVAQLN